MSIFKFTNTIDADEDPLYIEADDQTEAKDIFTTKIGPVPSSMLKIEAVEFLPEGEELLNS